MRTRGRPDVAARGFRMGWTRWIGLGTEPAEAGGNQIARKGRDGEHGCHGHQAKCSGLKRIDNELEEAEDNGDGDQNDPAADDQADAQSPDRAQAVRADDDCAKEGDGCEGWKPERGLVDLADNPLNGLKVVGLQNRELDVSCECGHSRDIDAEWDELNGNGGCDRAKLQIDLAIAGDEDVGLLAGDQARDLD